MKYIATFFRHHDETGQHLLSADDYSSAVAEAESLLEEGEHFVVGEAV